MENHRQGEKVKTLTVITTTYNRGYCLHQVYQSLCRQSSKDYIWMIIDDGSTDNTRELVQKWKSESAIEIEYYYKTNGGMHTARNVAYNLAGTELNMIVDSDDWLVDDAVENIIDFWNKNKTEKAYGIIAYNVTKDGRIVGSSLPGEGIFSTLTELENRYHVKGDKKLILRSDLSKEYPFPEFPNEKFYPASYKYRMLDLKYGLLIMKKAVCVVDYNEDSMTFSKYSQYKQNPRGFAHFRNEMIRISKSPKVIFRENIHYIAESKFANDKNYISRSSKPFFTVLVLPIGLLYYSYLKRTNRQF